MTVERFEFSNKCFGKQYQMKKFNIKTLVVVCTCVMALIFGGYLYYGANFAPGWHVRRSGASFYILAETGKRAVGMHLIDNSSYLFDENGYIMTGWQEYDGETYYFDEDGVMQKGTVTIDGVKYHLSDESGIFRTGLCSINGEEYFLTIKVFLIQVLQMSRVNTIIMIRKERKLPDGSN